MVGNKEDTIDDEITLDKNKNDDECDDCDEDELRVEDDKNKNVTLEEIDNCLDAVETASKKTKQIIKTSSANQNNKENENEKPWTPSNNDQLAKELFELQERLRQKKLFLASL